MNDTPRTDAAQDILQTWDNIPDFVMFVRDLERESDRLAKQCVRNVEEIGTLRAEVRKLERERDGTRACLKSWKEDEGADAKRMEWLMNTSFIEITRDGIDAAMEAEQS